MSSQLVPIGGNRQVSARKAARTKVGRGTSEGRRGKEKNNIPQNHQRDPQKNKAHIEAIPQPKQEIR